MPTVVEDMPLEQQVEAAARALFTHLQHPMSAVTFDSSSVKVRDSLRAQALVCIQATCERRGQNER